MFATGETVGLAEWIIHDTCLVLFYIKTSLSRILFSFILRERPIHSLKFEVNPTVKEEEGP